ncbi:MAG TPA: histidine kinase dimerization/phospho-acceptor domain-containing protein, partial [Microvirga sp.]|nr:histidine kinase dimerization/phospho-acceptor domain-containing protein [Microvirga sp.]
MRTLFTMDWVDHWLAGLVHQSGRSDPTECFRHERFIVSRTVSTLAALAAIPPYLIGRGAPTALEILSLAVFLAPLAAVVLASRTGRLDGAQAIVSAALMLFAAGASATFGGTSTLAILALAFVPLEALLSGSRRATAVAALLGLFGIPFVLIFGANGLGGGGPTALATVFAVGFAVALGHAVGQAVGDFRLRAHLQAALRSGEARESAAFQAIDDLVTWHDRNGHVVKASPAATKLLGVSPSCLVGRGLLSRVHVSDRPAFLKAISDAALADRPVALEFRLHLEASEGREDRHPARVIWVETRAHRIDAEAGATGEYAVVAVTRDVTDHKRRAEDFERARSDAEAADESKARFLATVSHELRTPLNAIIGFSEMLMNEEAMKLDVARRHDYAELINASGQHLLSVVNGILDMSKIETGNFEITPEPFAPGAVIKNCCELLALRARESGLTLAVSVPAD